MRTQKLSRMILIERFYEIFKKAAITLIVIFAVLLLDKFLSLLAENVLGFSLHGYDWPEMCIKFYRFLVLFSLAGGVFCLILFLSIWLYCYLNRQNLLPSRLYNVSAEQEKKIIRLLKQAATSKGGTDKMNRSEVANFLAALKALGHLEDGGDYNNLRLWVEQVTGTHDADKGHFNEAYKRALDKRGESRYTQDLKSILGTA